MLFILHKYAKATYYMTVTDGKSLGEIYSRFLITH